MKGGTTVESIESSLLKEYKLGLPQISEQNEVVRRIEELLAIADNIESQYNSLKAKIDQLPQAILNKAFKGELVAQDSSDEPAGVLLERIKSATEKLEYKVKKSSMKLAAEPRGNYKTN